MAFSATSPFNDLPPLPPAADTESKAILKACIGARVALADLRVSAALLPNQSVLINTIPLLESQASSEIENIVTTSDELFQYSDDESGTSNPAVKEVLRYRTALYEGFRELDRRPVSTNAAIQVCSTIKHVEMQIRKQTGTALKNPRGDVIYTPPVGEQLIREKLANWERYIHGNPEVDPVIRMAVAHYQFEAIHPFSDGNGRTGRIINLLMLVESGLLDLPVLYLSRYILREKSGYYQGLNRVTRERAWEDWILYMLAAVKETAEWTSAKIRSIKKLMDDTKAFIERERPKIYTHELIAELFAQPYIRIRNLERAGIAKRQTASVYLRQLVEIGVLREMPVGREKLFIHEKFLRLLTRDEKTSLP